MWSYSEYNELLGTLSIASWWNSFDYFMVKFLSLVLITINTELNCLLDSSLCYENTKLLTIFLLLVLLRSDRCTDFSGPTREFLNSRWLAESEEDLAGSRLHHW